MPVRLTTGRHSGANAARTAWGVSCITAAVSGLLTAEVLMDSTFAVVRAEALFVSVLQPSQQPTAEQVCEAVTSTLRHVGASGCTERMAREFGDHPESAA